MELEELMELFAGSGGVRANFREVRRVSILVDPIETYGVLYFAPPERLARHVTKPGRSRIVVDGRRVAFRDEAGLQQVDLDTSELAEAIVANVMVVLRGDLESLRSRYEVSFQSELESWTLELRPRSRVLKGVVEKIRFSGRGREPAVMETFETNGDATALYLSEVELGLAWGEEDLASIFSIHPQ